MAILSKSGDDDQPGRSTGSGARGRASSAARAVNNSCDETPACCFPCINCAFIFFIFIMSALLFGVREVYFIRLTDTETMLAVQLLEVEEAYAEYYGDDLENFIYENNCTGDDDSFSADLSCYTLIDAADNTQALGALCSVEDLELHYNEATDETHCGVNSLAVQGCSSGFFQPDLPSFDPEGPALPCPDGYFCPANFICTIACPLGGSSE